MVRKKSMKGDYCPSARALDVIGDWWSLLIVREAFDGVTRFSAFQKNLGIARNILSERLRKLTGEESWNPCQTLMVARIRSIA